MREIFQNEDFCTLTTDTGYRKPLTVITLNDREELVITLRQYHTFIRGQVELNQFVEGLNAYGFLRMVRGHPELMKPLFVAHAGIKLTKGVRTL